MSILLVIALIALIGAGWYAWTQHVKVEAVQRHVASMAEQRSLPSEMDHLIRSLIEAIPRPVLLTTADRVVLDANRAALYLVGLPRERVVDRVLATIIQDYETTQMMKAAATTGAPQEHTISRTADRETWHVTVQPLSLPGFTTRSAISHLLLFIDDETQLRYLETVRKDFVASVSHELRTPLTSVKLLAETLVDTMADDPEHAHDMSRRITVEVDHLTGLVDDLLELSRIESGHIKLELEPTDINGVIEVSAERMRPLAEDRNIDIQVCCDASVPEAQGDGDRIGQVLINLMDNAIRFTPDGGTITLTASLTTSDMIKKAVNGRDSGVNVVGSDQVIVVQVRDTGVGISDDDLPRVFERFFKARELPASITNPRLHTKSNPGQYRGTGLGLAISRYIIEAHHGEIWAESQLGRGSTFSFTLPLAKRF